MKALNAAGLNRKYVITKSGTATSRISTVCLTAAHITSSSKCSNFGSVLVRSCTERAQRIVQSGVIPGTPDAGMGAFKCPKRNSLAHRPTIAVSVAGLKVPGKAAESATRANAMQPSINGKTSNFFMGTPFG